MVRQNIESSNLSSGSMEVWKHWNLMFQSRRDGFGFIWDVTLHGVLQYRVAYYDGDGTITQGGSGVLSYLPLNWCWM